MRIIRIAAITAVANLVCLGMSSAVLAQSNVSDALIFEPCRAVLGAVEEDAECATLVQPENPSDPESKQIDIAVVKFAAKSPARAADAFTIIQGGPGMSSIDLYLSRRATFERIRQTRDLLIVDQRGTGRSNAFTCQLPEDQFAIPTPAETKALANKCLDDFAGAAEYYTTAEAVIDLDTARRLAGYPQLTIYGVSYGTRVALEYARTFPDATRALVLDGVVPPTVNLAGNEIAKRSRQAFDAVVSRCSNDAACNAEFGDLRVKFEQARSNLVAARAVVRIKHPVSGVFIEREVGEMDLLGAVRLMPYTTESLALMPLTISQAAAGDYSMIAVQAIMAEEVLFDDYAIGMNNSIVCSEDFPFLQPHQTEVLTETYFGADMIQSFAAVCDVWPVSDQASTVQTVINHDIPTLILSGALDPITPPENGETLLKMLENARHVVVPGHGHGVIDRGCIPQLALNFVSSASFEEFDSSCSQRERAFPLFITPVGPAP